MRIWQLFQSRNVAVLLLGFLLTSCVQSAVDVDDMIVSSYQINRAPSSQLRNAVALRDVVTPDQDYYKTFKPAVEESLSLNDLLVVEGKVAKYYLDIEILRHERTVDDYKKDEYEADLKYTLVLQNQSAIVYSDEISTHASSDEKLGVPEETKAKVNEELGQLVGKIFVVGLMAAAGMSYVDQPAERNATESIRDAEAWAEGAVINKNLKAFIERLLNYEFVN